MSILIFVFVVAWLSVDRVSDPIDDMPNNVQLDLRGHCRVVAYKVQSCTVTCDLHSCRAQGLPCTPCSIICMQLVCDALSSLVARYLAYHLFYSVLVQYNGS